MTGDRGDLPPYHRTSSWPASPPGSPQHAQHAYQGNGNAMAPQIADVRERLRAVETLLPMLERVITERISGHHQRLQGAETHLSSSDRRMDLIEGRVSETERTVAPLPGHLNVMEARLTQSERRWEAWKAGLQYAAAALIFGLVVARKLTVEQAWTLLKLFLPLSPG
jgi:hypothetical protein